MEDNGLLIRKFDEHVALQKGDFGVDHHELHAVDDFFAHLGGILRDRDFLIRHDLFRHLLFGLLEFFRAFFLHEGDGFRKGIHGDVREIRQPDPVMRVIVGNVDARQGLVQGGDEGLEFVVVGFGLAHIHQDEALARFDHVIVDAHGHVGVEFHAVDVFGDDLAGFGFESRGDARAQNQANDRENHRTQYADFFERFSFPSPLCTFGFHPGTG